MFSWIGAAVVGLIVGAIAKLLVPGRDPGGWIITILIGVAGSFLSTFIGQRFGFYVDGERAGLIWSVIGAMVLLGGYRLIGKRQG